MPFLRGHLVRGKLHQPHDLTTFFSACPAPIPDFLLAFPAVTNGFRSGFRGHAAERIRTPIADMEAALAHAVKNEAEAAYARSDLFEKRRVLMQSWSDYLAA